MWSDRYLYVIWPSQLQFNLTEKSHRVQNFPTIIQKPFRLVELKGYSTWEYEEIHVIVILYVKRRGFT